MNNKDKKRVEEVVEKIARHRAGVCKEGLTWEERGEATHNWFVNDTKEILSLKDSKGNLMIAILSDYDTQNIDEHYQRVIIVGEEE